MIFYNPRLDLIALKIDNMLLIEEPGIYMCITEEWINVL